jgi:hypothetical protein
MLAVVTFATDTSYGLVNLGQKDGSLVLAIHEACRVANELPCSLFRKRHTETQHYTHMSKCTHAVPLCVSFQSPSSHCETDTAHITLFRADAICLLPEQVPILKKPLPAP